MHSLHDLHEFWTDVPIDPLSGSDSSRKQPFVEIGSLGAVEIGTWRKLRKSISNVSYNFLRCEIDLSLMILRIRERLHIDFFPPAYQSNGSWGTAAR